MSSSLSAPLGLEPLPAFPHGRTASRLTWPHLPPEVRSQVESRLGARVVSHRSCDGGFTPGFASVLTTATGDSHFVKAASLQAQRPFADSYLAEAHMLRALGPGVPAPQLEWVHHDRRPGGWVVVCIQAVDGRTPRRPWRTRDLTRALDLCATITDSTEPLLEDLGLPGLSEELPKLVSGWELISTTWPHHAAADALARRLPELGEAAFVHADLRDDNILLGAEQTWACDWNWCVAGTALFDPVGLLVSAYADGVDVSGYLGHPVLAGSDAEEIDIVLAAIAGYMNAARQLPVPPTSPYLRLHGAYWGEAAWAWLAERRGWA